MQTNFSLRVAGRLAGSLEKHVLQDGKWVPTPGESAAPKGDHPEESGVKPARKLNVTLIPSYVKDLSASIAKAGGRALLVGGSVRDQLTGKAPKDFDLEVYGLSPDKLEAVLKAAGKVNAVGKSFGVLKLTLDGKELDVSIPRRENKTGKGHKGFIATPDPTMTIEEAARRRDFTMNSMAMDPVTGEVFDPFNGLEDIKNGVIRATDPKTFVEDPLRVLRAAQFAARFGMKVDPATIELSRSVKDSLKELAHERVGVEWEKLMMKSLAPSVGIDVLQQTGALEVLHPEMHAMHGSTQDPVFHSEGDVLVHTKMVIDEAIKQSEGLPDQDRKAVIYAALLHDIAKPQTREEVFVEAVGRTMVRNYGHEEMGEPIARKIAIEQLGLDKDTAEKVAKLVGEHLKPKLLFKMKDQIGDAAIRRLARRLQPATIDSLVALGKADSLGRRDLSKPGRGTPEEDWLKKRSEELQVSKEPTKPLLLGRHLMAEGVQPGKAMGDTLKRVYELQLDGKVSTLDEALHAAGFKKKE